MARGKVSGGVGAAAIAIVLLLPAAAVAQPLPDPLRAGSLPLGLEELAPVEAGGWRVELVTAYFNELQGSWHTATIHREVGRVGLPISDDELRLIEERHGADDVYHIDLEGWRNDLILAHGLGHGTTVTLRVPWIEIGRPHGDEISRRFHELFGISQNDRLLFPKGDTFVYLRSGGRSVTWRHELDGHQLGDVELAMSGRLGRWLGADHRWALALEAPTGDADHVGGSGGWDLGLRWNATFRPGRQEITMAAGWSWLADGGTALGFPRRDTWHVLGKWRSPPWRRTRFDVAMRLDSKPLDRFRDGRIAEAAANLTLGATRPIVDGWWLGFALGENWPDLGTGPDVSFHLSVGSAW